MRGGGSGWAAEGAEASVRQLYGGRVCTAHVLWTTGADTSGWQRHSDNRLRAEGWRRCPCHVAHVLQDIILQVQPDESCPVPGSGMAPNAMRPDIPTDFTVARPWAPTGRVPGRTRCAGLSCTRCLRGACPACTECVVAPSTPQVMRFAIPLSPAHIRPTAFEGMPRIPLTPRFILPRSVTCQAADLTQDIRGVTWK